MDTPSALMFLGLVHGLIFLVLLAILFVSSRRSAVLDAAPLKKAKSLIEQHLVLEAISACAGERDLADIVRSIGKHAAEMTGFSEWIIWLLGDGGEFLAADGELDGEESLNEGLLGSRDPRLYEWVKQNAAPVSMGKHVVQFSEHAEMKSALERLANGLLIPFMDGESILGFLILGGRRMSVERRSNQFLSLFGAFAAIIIKKSRLDQQERELRQRQQRDENLASLGKLAAGLAHEIRNPLTFIKASAQHLRGGYDFKPRDRELTDGMIEEIDRINRLISELLSLGRIDPRQFKPVEITEEIRKAARLAETKAEEDGIAIGLKLDEKKALVKGSEELLRQLFLNLIINGIQATERGGGITLRSCRDAGCLSVEVEDSGGGIDPEIIDSIFDPFFTTKETGTGLGLTICFSVARAHGGSLELLRSDAAGSCFRIKLPLMH